MRKRGPELWEEQAAVRSAVNSAEGGRHVPVLATLHYLDILKDYSMMWCTVGDWRKVPRLLSKEWPRCLPPARLYTPSNITKEEHDKWWSDAEQAPYFCLDTEYVDKRPVHTRLLRLAGVYYPGALWAYQCWWMGSGDPSWVRGEFRERLHTLIRHTPIVTFNLCADLPTLKGSLGIDYHQYKGWEDPMLAHGVLYPDLPHDFQFCQSVYGQYEKVKHLSEVDEARYNLGDTVELEPIWEGIKKELAADPLVEKVYREQMLPLVPIILEAMEHGIKVNVEKCQQLFEGYRELQTTATNFAHSATQFGINLASGPQLRDYAYKVKGYKEKKHHKTKKPTLDEGAVAALRQEIGPYYDAEEEEQEGLSIEAAEERVVAGADPVLEARRIYQQCESALKYLEGMLEGRIYPEINIHSQAGGRMTITNPPVQQYFDEIEELLEPDEGWALVEYDSRQLEPRILAYLSDDQPTIQVFNEGGDIYKTACTEAFSRVNPLLRKFTKSVIILRSNYGGDPREAGKHPSAKTLGLPGHDIVKGAVAYLQAHPAKKVYWDQIIRQIDDTRMIRTIGGRRRIAYQGRKVDKATYRELFNTIMQGSASDVLNLTTVEMKRRLPYCRLMWTKHDSAKWAVPLHRLEETLPVMKEVVEQTKWKVGKYEVCFPAEWKVRQFCVSENP